MRDRVLVSDALRLRGTHSDPVARVLSSVETTRVYV